MKNKLCLFLLVISAQYTAVFGWGEEGHALIAKKAIAQLPPEMAEFQKFSSYIEMHVSDPDKRKKDDRSEEPRHYIDIDFYHEFRTGKMIYDRDSLVSLYGDSVVTSQGILPWATFDTYKNLVQAFKDGNRDRVLIYASDLAHYVGDGYQPLHAVTNYNGQLTNQKGVHARYEIHMVNRYLNVLDNSFYNQTAYYIPTTLDFIFYYITNTCLLSTLIFDADNQAFIESGSRESEEYYSILWFRTKYITILQLNNSATALASLLYSAWTEAGKPDLKELG